MTITIIIIIAIIAIIIIMEHFIVYVGILWSCFVEASVELFVKKNVRVRLFAHMPTPV